MAIENPPLALQVASAKHPAELVRRALSSILKSVGGTVAAGDFAVTEHVAANMSVNVAAGQIWVPGTSTAAQGQYYVRNNATVNPAISASDATNPRIEKVVVRVKDEAYAGVENEAVLEVVKGTAEAGATLANRKGAAATPASSYILAYVLVPAKATTIVAANIENVVLPVRMSTTSLAAGVWLPIPPAAKIESTIVPPFVRLMPGGDVLAFKGLFAVKAAETLNDGGLVGTLPVGARPVETQTFAQCYHLGAGADKPFKWIAESNGELRAYGGLGTFAAGSELGLGGCFIPAT